MDTFPPTKQRPAILAFQKAAGTRTSCLHRDECGDWCIQGRHGHIYACPEGYQLVIGAEIADWENSTVRKWTADKGRLGFCKLTQDGDDSGCMILSRLPTKTEGAVIRSVLGIPKKVELAAGQLAVLAAHSFKRPHAP